MAEAWQAQQDRKRKVIVLSDSDTEDEIDSGGGGGKRSKLNRDAQEGTIYFLLYHNCTDGGCRYCYAVMMLLFLLV